jgi:hypothetical protein
MRPLIAFLTVGYIAAIFLLAELPIVNKLLTFNPYSLLHIPLYGILTVLLFFSFFPIALQPNRPNDSTAQRQNKIVPQLPDNLMPRFLYVGIISSGVAIVDEIHQAYIPDRDASIMDVFLDMIGIILIMLLIMLYYKKKRSRTTNKLITH